MSGLNYTTLVTNCKQFLVNPPKPELGIMFNVNVRHMYVLGICTKPIGFLRGQLHLNQWDQT